MLISPCFHYLITHCNEEPVLDKPTRNSLLSYDEVRTLMYIMLISRKEGISIEQLKQLYIMVDIQYHSYSWVSRGSLTYFGKDISSNSYFDADKLVVEIENRLSSTLNEYSKFKCADFYTQIRKDRELCKCCPFYRSRKSNYALDEKFHLICYMMRSHENFNNIVSIANKFNINMEELLYYNYDIRVCGALPLDTKDPLLVPFFQVLYHICAAKNSNSVNAFIDSSIDLNPDIVIKNDPLFIKLLDYLVSDDFIYHKDWRKEFEEIFQLKSGTYDFKELLSTDMLYKTSATIKWLESMYKEVFTGARYEENFSVSDTIESIAKKSRGYIFLSKEDFQRWKREHKTSDVVPANYFTQNIFENSGFSVISTPFYQDERASVSEPVEENKANKEDTTTNGTNSSGVPPLLLPGVHNTIEDVFKGITTVEQVNKLHAEKKDTQNNENLEHNVSDSEFMSNFEVKSKVNLEVDTGVESKVNLEVDLEVDLDSKIPLISKDIDSYMPLDDTYFNPIINPVSNLYINIDSEDIDADEAEYDLLLDTKNPDYVQQPLEKSENADMELAEETVIQYSKVLFDNYIEYRRVTSSIPSSRTIYYSPAELLTNYPLDITMAGSYRGRLQKKGAEPFTPAALSRTEPKRKLIGTSVSHQSLKSRIINVITPKSTDTIPTLFPDYSLLTPRETKLLDILCSQPTTNVPRKSYISFTDSFFANYDFSKLTDMLPNHIVSSRILRKYATNLSYEHGLKDFETALIKDHCLCIEAVCDNNDNDYLIFYLNSMAISGPHKLQNTWYYIKLGKDNDVLEIISAYISRKSYVKICYSSHQLYAIFKKYDIPFRNVFSISSALGIVASKYNAVSYHRLYKNLFNSHIFDNKQLPDIMKLMRKNVTMYRCLQSLLNHLNYNETWQYQQYFEIVLGCSYLPYNVFPVSKCTLYRVIDYNTYYMNTYTGRNALIKGSFIRFSIKKKYLNSLEDYALIPAVLVALAYKGLFRKYHIYLTEYSSYSCNLFVEEKATSTTLSIIISEATNRIKLMYPERIKNVSLLDINCSPAHYTPQKHT